MVTAVRDNSVPDVEFSFLAFSLDQAHVPEGEPPVWERPPDERGRGVLALEWGIAVRDRFPDRFVDAHVALFAARHDHARKLQEEATLRAAATEAGLDPDAVAEEVASGRPLSSLTREHDEATRRWHVFGVPTFIEGENAVFVRFMERASVADLARIVDLIAWTDLNELKRTRIPR